MAGIPKRGGNHGPKRIIVSSMDELWRLSKRGWCAYLRDVIDGNETDLQKHGAIRVGTLRATVTDMDEEQARLLLEREEG